MKRNVIITSTALALLLGIVVPAYAQQDQRGDKQDQTRQQQRAKEQGKPEQQRARQQQGQDRQQQQAQQQQRQNQSRRQDQRGQQQQYQDRQQQQAGQEQRPQRNQEQQRAWQSIWQNHRARNWQSDHRTWQQRGGYDGYRIPEDRYRGYFGPQHRFGLYGLPFMVYDGYPRFQYQGYWITLVDPWPQEWSNNWYDNDDVYITYGNDGYYMYDRNYPGKGIAISISR